MVNEKYVLRTLLLVRNDNHKLEMGRCLLLSMCDTEQVVQSFQLKNLFCYSILLLFLSFAQYLSLISL